MRVRLIGSGRRAIRVPGDISDRAQCARVVERAVGELGRVDVLVNNAAYQMTFDSI